MKVTDKVTEFYCKKMERKYRAVGPFNRNLLRLWDYATKFKRVSNWANNSLRVRRRISNRHYVGKQELAKHER